MGLNKRQYTDGQTIITAANLNEIQDCIIAIEGSYVPKTRTINSKQLNGNITLSATDVGAVPTSRTINSKQLNGNITLSAADVGAVPVSRTVNNKQLSSNITLSAADVGAVPTSRKVNNKQLSSDISLTYSDVGAVPTGRKVNNKQLSSDITLAATDIGYGSSNVGATLGSLNTAINDFYFKHNESFAHNVSCTVIGFCSNASKQIMFDVALPKLLNNISNSNITIQNINCAFRTATGGYIENAGSKSTWVSDSTYTFVAEKSTNNIIRITMNKATAMNTVDNNGNVTGTVSNNSSISFFGKITLQFT